MSDEIRNYLDSITDYLNVTAAPILIKQAFTEIRKFVEEHAKIKMKLEEKEKNKQYSKLLKDLYGE